VEEALDGGGEDEEAYSEKKVLVDDIRVNESG
jgi:hypothetical protein